MHQSHGQSCYRPHPRDRSTYRTQWASTAAKDTSGERCPWAEYMGKGLLLKSSPALIDMNGRLVRLHLDGQPEVCNLGACWPVFLVTVASQQRPIQKDIVSLKMVRRGSARRHPQAVHQGCLHKAYQNKPLRRTGHHSILVSSHPQQPGGLGQDLALRNSCSGLTHVHTMMLLAEEHVKLVGVGARLGAQLLTRNKQKMSSAEPAIPWQFGLSDAMHEEG